MFDVVPGHMRGEFLLLGASAVFEAGSVPRGPCVVACTCTEVAGYVERLGGDDRAVCVVSNDFGLSTLARRAERAGEGSLERFLRSLKREGRFLDVFQSAHGSRGLVRELLADLLLSRSCIRVMVSHVADAASLRGAFQEGVQLVDEFCA